MENIFKHTYHVSGMSCGGCVSTVKNKLSNVTGVTTVNVDLANKQAEITSTEEIKTETLQSAFINTGYVISDLRV